MKFLRYIGLAGCLMVSGFTIEAAQKNDGYDDIQAAARIFGAMLLQNQQLAESGQADPVGQIALARIRWENTLMRDYAPAYAAIQTCYAKLSDRGKQLYKDAFDRLRFDFETMRDLTQHGLNRCNSTLGRTPDEVTRPFFASKKVPSLAILFPEAPVLADRQPVYVGKVVDRIARECKIELTVSERANIVNAFLLCYENEVRGHVTKFMQETEDFPQSLRRCDTLLASDTNTWQDKLDTLQSWILHDVPRICREVSQVWEAHCRHDFFADDFGDRDGTNAYANMYSHAVQYIEDIKRMRRGGRPQACQMITVVAAVKEAQRQVAEACGGSAAKQLQSTQESQAAERRARELIAAEAASAVAGAGKSMLPKKPNASAKPSTGGLEYPTYPLPGGSLFEVYGRKGSQLIRYYLSSKGVACSTANMAVLPDGAVVKVDGDARKLVDAAVKRDLKHLKAAAQQQREQAARSSTGAKKKAAKSPQAGAAAGSPLIQDEEPCSPVGGGWSEEPLSSVLAMHRPVGWWLDGEMPPAGPKRDYADVD